jgi:SnoaL-like domain
VKRALLIAATTLIAILPGSRDVGIAQAPDGNLARLIALEAELDSLEHQIQSLEDAKAIKRLQRAYGYYVDKALSDEVADLFSRDATAEIGGYGVFVGKARVAELYHRLLGDGLAPGQLNNHMILQGVVHVDPNGTTAKGRWRALIQLGQIGETALWSEGPYENEYVKEDGIWRISKLHWYMTLTAPYSPGWHLESLPLGEPLEDLPPDRPPTESYGAYPSAYLPLYHYDNPVSGRKAGQVQ